MLLIKDGNQRAFGILVNRYLSKVLSYADNIVGPACDDIIQETFTSIWQNAYKFNQEKATFKTWLYTILNNNCYNYLKKSKLLKLNNIEDFEDSIASPEKNTEEILITRQANEELKEHINNLNKREQQAISLRYFEELSTKETAKIMNSSIKAVETLLNRSRKKLKHYFNKKPERL